LSEAKRQQVLALGQLGWPLRRIEDATGVRRETAGAYLKAAGLPVRAPRPADRPAPGGTDGTPFVPAGASARRAAV